MQRWIIKFYASRGEDPKFVASQACVPDAAVIAAVIERSHIIPQARPASDVPVEQSPS